ncbi:MAG: hypothetical protein ABI846_10245 [Rudaea sp.]
MRILDAYEARNVCGGDLECTVGIPTGVSCKGSPADFANAIATGYNAAVSATTDLFCWIAGVP